MRIHRYTQWDGSQEILFPNADDVLKHVSDALLDEGGVRKALRDVMRAGFTSEDGLREIKGTKDLIKEVEAKKNEILQRFSPNSFKLSQEEVQQLTEKIVGLAEKFEDYKEKMRHFRERFSGRYAQEMPDLQQQMQGAYDQYRQLLDQLRDQIAHRGMEPNQKSPEQEAEGLAQMLERLNSMLEDDTFLNNLPEMLQAAMEDVDRLMDSLDGFNEEQLNRLSEQLAQMEQLEQILNQHPFQGPERMGMGEALGVLNQLRGLEQLLRWGRRGLGDLSELDLEDIRELLGDEVYEQIKYLKGLEQMMVESGCLAQTEEGLRLSPKGMRRIADKALREVFQMLNRDRSGDHSTFRRGQRGETTEDTKVYEYGDPLQIHISETLRNAMASGGPGVPLHIGPRDFSVYRQEFATDTETVLCIDVSYSMLMNDALRAGKKVALALHRLIETKFPQDLLHLVAFRSNAREIRAEDLPSIVSITYYMEHGTDIKEALRYSRQMFGSQRAANRQIILITDGEPTAASLDLGGRLHSGWGSTLLHERIVHETLKEVRRCTQCGIRINTFMLGTEFYRKDFVEQLTRLNSGRVFYTSPEQVGNYILVDYIANRRKRIG